jgi:hypothetical protein
MLRTKNGHTTLFLVLYWHYSTSRALNSSVISPRGPRFRHIHRTPSRPAAIVRSFSTIKNVTGWSCNPTPPTIILEIQGNTLSLGHDLWLVRHERPYQQLRYLRGTSQDHLPTQLQSQRQSRDTLGGETCLSTCSVYFCYIALQRNLPVTEPQGINFFSVASRFRLIHVLETWIIGTSYSWGCEIFSVKDRFPLCKGSV